MARIRTIKPEIHQDEAFGRCSIPCRLLYIGLVTQADDEGRMRGAPELIRALIFPYDNPEVDVEPLLAQLQGCGLIARYVVREQCYIALPNWSSHQKIDRPTPSKIPAFTGEMEDSTSPRRVLDESSCTDQGSRIKDRGSGNVEDDVMPRPEVSFLCHLLADSILGNDPKAKVRPHSRRWLDECRLLIDRDGRTPTEIQAVIEWATRDDFWRANILSMAKLREKFSTLRMQMERGQARRGTFRPRVLDWVAVEFPDADPRKVATVFESAARDPKLTGLAPAEQVRQFAMTRPAFAALLESA